MTEPRKPDPPLSTRECADFMGVSTGYIRSAIRAGELAAEEIRVPGRTRPMYRVHVDDFRAFLQRIQFKRVPA